MAGPDPAIPARTEIAKEAVVSSVSAATDGRVKLGHDEWSGPCEQPRVNFSAARYHTAQDARLDHLRVLRR